MLVFQVSSRTIQSGMPKKSPIRLHKWGKNILRIVCGGLIFGALATLLFISGLSILFFLLLPVCLSLIWTPSQLSKIFHGTLLYGVFTIGLALSYYSAIAGIEFFIHTPGFGLLFRSHGPPVSLIIVVTTTLAWAIILAPLYTFVQNLIEQRFNRHDYEAAKAIEAFISTLREEIDLAQLRDGLLVVVQQTMQPQAVSVWIQKLEPDKGMQSTNVQSRQNDLKATPEEGNQKKHEYARDSFQSTISSEFTVADHDPIIAYTLAHTGAVEVDKLQLDSPVLHSLKVNQVEIALPLVSQGELLGLLTLGPRLKGQDYAHDDRGLLNMLASQVAPALRVAQMVKAQQAQVSEHERIEQELRTAHEIQQTFLPKDVPALQGWRILPYYQSAREVGGDFYDFIPFEDGRLGLVIGDVTGKGIPAALVMTATRTMLRTAAQGIASPGEVFTRVNELLYAEIPPMMFVTCFYAILDPTSGFMRFANAGHDLPYQRHQGDVTELRATGMPLGLMSGSCYEELEATIEPGESLLFYTDGLVEAHNSNREMFGFPRLKTILEEHSDGTSLFNLLLSELENFTGKEWEQEDDITMVSLQRTSL